MSQNLLSLSFTDEQLLAVDTALSALEAALPGLISLTVDQRKGLRSGSDGEKCAIASPQSRSRGEKSVTAVPRSGNG